MRQRGAGRWLAAVSRSQLAGSHQQHALPRSRLSPAGHGVVSWGSSSAWLLRVSSGGVPVLGAGASVAAAASSGLITSRFSPHQFKVLLAPCQLTVPYRSLVSRITASSPSNRPALGGHVAWVGGRTVDEACGAQGHRRHARWAVEAFRMARPRAPFTACQPAGIWPFQVGTEYFSPTTGSSDSLSR